MKYILYAILIYLAYQLVFKLIIPVYLASRKFKQQFREVHQRMEEQRRQQQEGFAQPEKPQPSPKASHGDYIEFEEVK